MTRKNQNIMQGWRFGATSRARFRRQNFFLQGFLAAAPWLNILLVGALLCFVGKRHLTQRGTSFELPFAPLEEGAPLDTPTALLLEHENGALLFYEDLRYHADRSEDLSRFTESLRQTVREGHDEIILCADEKISLATLMPVVHAARAAGVRHVNVAGRKQSPPLF